VEGHQQHHPAATPTSELCTNIKRARAELDLARRQQALRNDPSGKVTAARCELVDALRAYLARLAAEGTPAPYRLRDELRLLTALVGAGRR